MFTVAVNFNKFNEDIIHNLLIRRHSCNKIYMI